MTGSQLQQPTLACSLAARAVRRNPRIEEAPLQGELMLFDPASSKFFVLNRTMAFLWSRCDGQESVADAVEGFSQEFEDVDVTAVESDLKHAVDELCRLGLLVEDPAS